MYRIAVGLLSLFVAATLAEAVFGGRCAQRRNAGQTLVRNLPCGGVRSAAWHRAIAAIFSHREKTRFQ